MAVLHRHQYFGYSKPRYIIHSWFSLINVSSSTRNLSSDEVAYDLELP
jgi:hypothetical protein